MLYVLQLSPADLVWVRHGAEDDVFDSLLDSFFAHCFGLACFDFAGGAGVLSCCYKEDGGAAGKGGREGGRVVHVSLDELCA